MAVIDEIKASQMAFIQKSTLTAYLVYVDAVESTDVNPPLMASQYMLNCLSFVRHWLVSSLNIQDRLQSPNPPF